MYLDLRNPDPEVFFFPHPFSLDKVKLAFAHAALRCIFLFSFLLFTRNSALSSILFPVFYSGRAHAVLSSPRFRESTCSIAVFFFSFLFFFLFFFSDFERAHAALRAYFLSFSFSFSLLLLFFFSFHNVSSTLQHSISSILFRESTCSIAVFFSSFLFFSFFLFSFFSSHQVCRTPR